MSPHLIETMSLGMGFHVANEIRHAASAEARARILLRVPDLVLMQMAPALESACAEVMFELGTRFIQVKVASFSAVKDELGDLPDAEWARVEIVAHTLRAVAGVRP
jgi:putative heme iron utilization protein